MLNKSFLSKVLFNSVLLRAVYTDRSWVKLGV